MSRKYIHHHKKPKDIVKYSDPSSAGVLTTLQPSATITQPIHRDLSMGFSSIFQQALGVLVNPDLAFRQDYELSLQMVRDPVVMTSLWKRMLSTAQLPWQIVSSNPDDPFQVDIAQQIDKIIRDMPRQQDFFIELLWGIFRGTGVSEVSWAQDPNTNEWKIAGHNPHNGDKFVSTIFGEFKILTRQFQVIGRPLTAGEKDRLIFHIYNPDDGSFYHGEEAAFSVKGRGVRDQIYWLWWLKQNSLKFWVQFLERCGGGLIVGKYPMGNDQAKVAIESVLQNLVDGSIVSLPVPPGAEDRETYSIDIKTVSGNDSTSKLWMDFVDNYCAKYIKLFIEGQQLTSEKGPTGLGSKQAEVHENTFEKYIKFDSGCLADTLTHQLVKKVQDFNFGPLDFQCKFEFIFEAENFEQEVKRIEAATKAKVAVPKQWVYDTLGIPVPKEGEETIILGQAQESEEQQEELDENVVNNNQGENIDNENNQLEKD